MTSPEFLGFLGTLIAALLAGIVALTLNVRDRRAMERDLQERLHREIYAEAYASVVSTEQTLLGLLRRALDGPDANISPKRRRDGLRRHWERLEAAQQRQIDAFARVTLLGKPDVSDALKEVTNSLGYVRLALVARSGEIESRENPGRELLDAQSCLQQVGETLLPNFLAEIKGDLGIDKLNHRHSQSRNGAEPRRQLAPQQRP